LKRVLDERLKSLREEYANRTELSREEAKRKEQLKKSLEIDLHLCERQQSAIGRVITIPIFALSAGAGAGAFLVS
jgi:hypothetical protein